MTGDFNLTPETEPIQLVKNDWKDSYEETSLPPFGPIGTGNSFNLNRKFNERIDYIFFQGDISVEKYGCLSDSYDNRFPSDHFPIVSRVKIN